ncbi:hypothetical protein MKS88_002682 [Plasmodium brasilianum]|uniref:Uncharacterized protein n=1 Tax=Plasmodium brasilianum TaxID=5824 RepID=A0ACB9YAR5_PLABR|nr:hypothetical protein MKS88_002682 [Plasmodium brasilianum]
MGFQSCAHKKDKNKKDKNKKDKNKKDKNKKDKEKKDKNKNDKNKKDKNKKDKNKNDKNKKDKNKKDKNKKLYTSTSNENIEDNIVSDFISEKADSNIGIRKGNRNVYQKNDQMKKSLISSSKSDASKRDSNFSTVEEAVKQNNIISTVRTNDSIISNEDTVSYLSTELKKDHTSLDYPLDEISGKSYYDNTSFVNFSPTEGVEDVQSGTVEYVEGDEEERGQYYLTDSDRKSCMTTSNSVKRRIDHGLDEKAKEKNVPFCRDGTNIRNTEGKSAEGSKINDNDNANGRADNKIKAVNRANRISEEQRSSSKLENLKDILHDQLKKKKSLLLEKLRAREHEKRKLEEDVKNAGLELFRINKESELLINREQELMNSLESIKCQKDIYTNENIELKKMYNNELLELKKALNYYIEIDYKLNNSLLELNNLKKYYDYVHVNSKISENVLSSNKEMKIKQKTINKKENILSKMKHELNELSSRISIKKELYKNEETECQNLQKLIKEEKKEVSILKEEKNKLIKNFNDSISNMKKRDEAIDEINNKLNQLKSNVSELEKSIEQLKKENIIEKEKKEKLLMEFRMLKRDKEKVKMDKEILEKNIEEICQYNEKIKEKIRNEKKKYDEINDVIQNIHKDVRIRENKIKVIKNGINQNIDKIINVYTEEIKIGHFSSKLKSELAAVKENIIKKESEMENYKNDIVRIKIQQILESTKRENMEKKMNKLNEEYDEKNSILCNYDNIIRKNHHLIENKQVEVDRLNEEFDKKNKKGADLHGIPVTLEMKIQKLNKQISDIIKDSRLLEKQWFFKQSEMIKIQNENSNINEEILKGKDLCLILGQKKCELQENYKNVKDIIKKLNKNILYIRLQLEKFASKNNDTLLKIEKIDDEMLKWNENINVKAEEYKNKKESLNIDINNLKNEKEQYQQDLLNYENKILFFEEKITEKKKLKGVIKEYIENKDIIQLKKQQQEKNIFIENMKKQKNIILANIKLALSKRNDLDNKKELFQKNYESGVNVSFKIQHEISLLKKNVKTTKNKKKYLTEHLSELTKTYDHLLNQMKDQQIYFSCLNQEYNMYQGIVQIKNFEKKHRFQELLKFQNAVKNVHILENSKKSYDHIKKACSTQKKRLSSIINILQNFSTNNEKYTQFISVILEWITN